MNRSSIQRFVEQHFEVVRHRSSSEELCFVCPVCGDQSGHRSVNLSSGLTHCFRCQTRQPGHIIGLLRSLGYEIDQGSDLVQEERLSSWQMLARSANNVLRALERKTPPRTRYALTIDLPVGFTPLSKSGPKSVYWRMAKALAERKNLTVEDFADAGAGYTLRDSDWEPYLIFPIRSFEGRIVYYQGRSFENAPDEPTKKFPNRQKAPIGMSGVLYGAERLAGAKRVVVVESILNVLSLRKRLEKSGDNGRLRWLAGSINDFDGVAAVSTLHADISDRQWALLGRVKTLEEVTILFDADAAAKAWVCAERCMRRHPRYRLSIAEMRGTKSNPTLDPNDDVDAALEALEARTIFSLERMMARRVLATIR